jgi:hypothetical protein
LDVEAF